ERPAAALPGRQRRLRARPRRLPRRPGSALAAAQLLRRGRGRAARGDAPHRRRLRGAARTGRGARTAAAPRRTARAVKVAVLRGGWSLERSVSLRSGGRIEGAVRALGHEPVGLDADRGLATALVRGGFDVAFIALHGAGGEDGVVQELCETLGVPYTGSGPAAAAIAFH